MEGGTCLHHKRFVENDEYRSKRPYPIDCPPTRGGGGEQGAQRAQHLVKREKVGDWVKGKRRMKQC